MAIRWGQHCIAFDREGERVGVRRRRRKIEVRFAMIPIYRFEHEGSEVWENGRAVRIDGTTNDNGEKFAITVRRNGDGYVRTSTAGSTIRRGQPSSLLEQGRRGTANVFLGGRGQDVKASFEYVGREKLAVAGKELEVEHYRMVGDEERDLWFDKAGRIAKVKFRRLGSEIEYLRDQVAPRAPTSSCAGALSTKPESAPSTDRR